MQYLKYDLHLSIPLADDKEGKLSIKERAELANTKLAEPITLAAGTKDAQMISTYDLIETAIAQLVALGVTVNLGQSNEEKPVASRHICRHEEGLPCIEEEVVMGHTL